ncbi:unnamed protein product, partial [Ixodes hexagonus]
LRRLKRGHRYLFGIFLLAILTISSSYVGTVMARLNAKQPSPFLDSLDKLKRHVAEGTIIPCIMSGSTLDIIINNPEERNEFLLGIRALLEKYPDMRSTDMSGFLQLTSKSDKYVTIGMPEVLATAAAFFPREESMKLVLSEENLAFNLGSPYVSTFSPYMDSFNLLIRSLREAGLIERWFRNITAALHTKSFISQAMSESDTWEPFGQQQLG